MEQKTVRRIGNSFGIIIPNSIVRRLKLADGSKVYLELYEEERALVIRLKRNYADGITPKFLKLVNDFMERYGDALQELANR